MKTPGSRPRVVLICHENDGIDCKGLAAWLACSFCLSGIVLLREKPGSTFKKIRREYTRVGLLRLIDVLLFRLFYRLRYSRSDQAWAEKTLQSLLKKYPANTDAIETITVFNPNDDRVRYFLERLQPDLTIARCKFILKPAIFDIARTGTFVMHPGICPEYRNAHGCFWALVKRDLKHVGMTLLKVDAGIDTGTVYLHSSYSFDETHESHIVIQYRVVLENLQRITNVLYDIYNASATPVKRPCHFSRAWGQPWLTAYLYWKLSARGVLA